MNDVELSRYAAEAFRHMDRAPHPSIDQMAEFVSGELTASAGIEFESHLERCDSCRRRLEEYEQFVSDSDRPAVKDLAREWTRLRRRIQWHKATATVVRWRTAAAVATLAAVAGISWLLVGLLSTSPAQLLARAYQEERPFDIRLAGAKHSDVKRQRGGGSMSSNVAWLKAKARLEEQTRSKPDDPETLRLLGEAEMMSREAAKAVQTLQKARDLKPNDAAILADLGAAYALRGEIENQFGDYMSAIDYMGQSLHLKPRVAEVVFNLALVLERDAQLKDQAIEQWNLYLELDPSSDWAREARQHRDDLEKVLQSREEALHQTVEDPAQFLARVASGEPIDAEAYLRDVVITKWLPLATSDGPARQATIKLAQILKERHGDTWLSEMVNSISGPQLQAALQNLAAVPAASQSGHADVALAGARAARQAFMQFGSLPGVICAGFEEVASLRGLLRHGECATAAAALLPKLSPQPYPWIRANLLIEYAICEMRLGQLGQATTHLREAMQISRAAGLPSVTLIAGNMNLACLRHIGLAADVFSSAEQSLRTFWSGAQPPKLFYQVVDELRDLAARSDQKHAAWLLARSEVWAALATFDTRVEALTRGSLAVAAQLAGEDKEALANLETSERLFGALPPGYRLEMQVTFAEVELRRGGVDSALQRLEIIRSHFDPPPSVLLGTLYYSVLGEARRQKGQLSLANDALRRSIDFGSQRVASLSSETEKSGVLDTIEKSYRGLVATTLATSTEPADSLRVWQSFRALDGVGNTYLRPPDDVVLFFVVLEDEIVSWLSRNDRVTTNRIRIPRDAVAALVARFRRECSDPASLDSLRRADAEQLYRLMVEPFAGQLTQRDHILILDLDGPLRGVPVQALLTPQGSYLGDRFSVVISSGHPNAPRTDVLSSDAHAVVVVNPLIGGESAAGFPPLSDAEREAETVCRSFSASTILEGRDATIDALARSLPGADVVHFVGHGYAASQNGALILAPKDPQNADYALLQSEGIRREDWSHCRLAVLSTCAAAEGETLGAYNSDSLVRGLTRAGVSSVIASLWNVDSAATAALMIDLYTALSRGENPARALTLAQQQMRSRNPAWEHPYYWSGFQLYGAA